jgi:(2Fe-2S) ferredoxin
VAFDEGDHVVLKGVQVVWWHHSVAYSRRWPRLPAERGGGKPDAFPVLWKEERDLASFERHLFICTNQREPGSARGCCSPDGKGELQRLFKEAIGAAGLKATVRANKAGCLDQCEHGPTVVVYPEAVWYGFVRPEDVPEIIEEHVKHGRPVERLRLAENCVNTASCPHKPRRQ